MESVQLAALMLLCSAVLCSLFYGQMCNSNCEF